MKFVSYVPNSPAETAQLINIGDGSDMASLSGNWYFEQESSGSRGIRPFELTKAVGGRVLQLPAFVMGSVEATEDQARLQTYPVATVTLPPTRNLWDRLTGAHPEGKKTRVGLDPNLAKDLDAFFLTAAATAVYNHVNGIPSRARVLAEWDSFLAQKAREETEAARVSSKKHDKG